MTLFRKLGLLFTEREKENLPRFRVPNTRASSILVWELGLERNERKTFQTMVLLVAKRKSNLSWVMDGWRLGFCVVCSLLMLWYNGGLLILWSHSSIMPSDFKGAYVTSAAL